MDWRCQLADIHAIMWATVARDLSPRPPLLKERGRKAERCLTGVLYALGLTGKRHRGTFASPVRRPITVPPSFRKGIRGVVRVRGGGKRSVELTLFYISSD